MGVELFKECLSIAQMNRKDLLWKLFMEMEADLFWVNTETVMQHVIEHGSDPGRDRIIQEISGLVEVLWTGGKMTVVIDIKKRKRTALLVWNCDHIVVVDVNNRSRNLTCNPTIELSKLNIDDEVMITFCNARFRQPSFSTITFFTRIPLE
ncbi:unnamed protein product [Angiostrongylus costaricensis]|uniref:SHSP domain-containing protein n=1 Tax=Angiostrongylus costaricensis TaxID=334426 RepID=A0A158PEK2_ANGCS|nr:unnamed protein product [Angiostrongylus costaricensis]